MAPKDQGQDPARDARKGNQPWRRSKSSCDLRDHLHWKEVHPVHPTAKARNARQPLLRLGNSRHERTTVWNGVFCVPGLDPSKI